jgi:hypothetical protein
MSIYLVSTGINDHITAEISRVLIINPIRILKLNIQILD